MFMGLINKIKIQKLYINIKIIINDFFLDMMALFDTGADSNFILEGLIPTKFFEKTSEKLNIIFLPKWFVVIPSLDIWMGNKDLMKGVPKISSFLRFFTRRKFVLILRLWFSMIMYLYLGLLCHFLSITSKY